MHAYMLQYVNPFPCQLFTSLAKMFTDVFLCVIFKLHGGVSRGAQWMMYLALEVSD